MGEKVKKNSTVTVVISSGEAAEKVQVPNVVDKSEAEAEKLLQDAGLKVTKGEPQNSDTIAAGNVISSDPAANTEVDDGTSVTIVISLGKEDVKVPDLRNHSAADAESALAAAGTRGRRIPGLQRYGPLRGMSSPRVRTQAAPWKQVQL